MLLRSGKSGPLKIKEGHSECMGADRNFATNLTETNNAKCTAAQSSHAREAPPIRAWGMSSIKCDVRPVESSKMVNADQSIQFLYSPDKRKHQCKGMFGASDIGAAAYTQHLDATRLACSDINIPKKRTVFMDYFQAWR